MTSQLSQQGLQDVFNSITAFTPWVQAVMVMFSAKGLSQPKPDSEKVENSTCASPTQLPPCSLVAD